jgi:tricorn protease
MLRLLVVLLAVLSNLAAFAAPPAAPAADPDDMRLLRMPDVHGDALVFVYGGDLWLASGSGGEARRLTSSVGYEYSPKFSPDGRWIAFSGEYDGNPDVYVMPAAGGEPVRLTFHPGADRVIDWQPDGESIRFQSARQSHTGRDLQLYTVPRTGGLPERMILPTAGLSSYAPDGHRIAYTPTTTENRTWKRYKGGWAQDIWIYDLAANTSEKITDWVGADNFPMWVGDTIYFTSDREAGKLNIWAYDTVNRSQRQVTRHDEYDVKYPSLGEDAIVYENGGWIWRLDLASGETHRLRIGVHSDQVWARPRLESADDQVRGADIAPDGKRVAVDARGEIFSVPAEKGPVRDLTATPGVRERCPMWSPDGKQIAYVGDATDEYEIYLRPAAGAGEPRQLTSGLGSWINSMRWAPDGKHLAVSTAALDLLLVDAASGKITKVDHSAIGDINGYAFSPAGDWLAYARTEPNEFSSIFLYELKSGAIHRVTTEFTNEGSPCFDDEGKYLFFTSARHFNPTLGGFDLHPLWVNQDGLFLVTLRDDVPHPFPPESDEVGEGDASDDDQAKGEEAKSAPAAKGKKDKSPARTEAKPPLRIDVDGLTDRIVDLDVPAGNYGSLSFSDGKLFYLSRPFIAGGSGGDDDDEEGPAAQLRVFVLKDRKAKTVLEKVDGYDLSADGKKVLYGSHGKLGIVDAEPDQKPAEKPLRTDEMKAMVDPHAEWREMLRDAWRLERDFFYDPALHQVDWPHMYERYGQLVPYVAHGADFSYVVGEMISELNAGHAYVRPGDMPHARPIGTGLLGCDYELDRSSGRYRFAHIFSERDWNGGEPAPLAAPGVNVKVGDYLLAVDGVDLEAPTNPFSLFIDKAGEAVRLTVGPHPDGKGSREVTVVTVADENDLRYEAWVQANRRRVDELSGGKIGYLHLPNTAVGGQQGFAKGYYPQLRKEGLIIDERYNAGGFIPDFFMNILRQKMVNFWRPRFGQDWRTPGTAFMGHLAMLSNGYAGSGGDALPYYFKFYELGPVIGTRTWGGLVGISRDIPLMDGGNVTFPEFGLYDLEGKLAVENHGVDPTIALENLPQDEAAGRDAQLEKAVEVLLQKIAAEPVRMPEFKGFPTDRK